MSGVTTAARCWSDSAVGERFSCVFGGEMGWRGGEYVRGGDKFGCDGCGDWNVAVLQGPAATAARWFAMTDGVVPGVMRGGRVYEAEVPGPGPDIVAEREYPDEKELGLPSSRRGDWARINSAVDAGESTPQLRVLVTLQVSKVKSIKFPQLNLFGSSSVASDNVRARGRRGARPWCVQVHSPRCRFQ